MPLGCAENTCSAVYEKMGHVERGDGLLLDMEDPRKPFIGRRDSSYEHGTHENIGVNLNQSVMSEGTEPPSAPTPSRHPRLLSVDAIRGLTIAIMILVDDLGDWFPVIDHSPWNNVTLADFVMPFFLFIVGVAIPLSFQKFLLDPEVTGEVRRSVLKKVTVRTLKLFFLGLLLQGGGFPIPGGMGFDLHTLRIGGILQRIALAYFVVGFAEIYLPRFRYRQLLDTLHMLQYEYEEHESRPIWTTFQLWITYLPHWICAGAIGLIYLCTMKLTTVPSYEFNDTIVTCDVAGDIGPWCNAAGYVDRTILGFSHMYSQPTYIRLPVCSSCSPGYCPRPDAPPTCSVPYDPEGILTSIHAIVSCFIGLHFGHVIVYFGGLKQRVVHFSIVSTIMIGLGLFVDHVLDWPMNKNLYSPSYVLMMGGAAGWFLLTFMLVIDGFANKKAPPQHVFEDTVKTMLLQTFKPLVYMGMNAILIFVFAASDVLDVVFMYVWYKEPNNNLVYWAQNTLYKDWMFKHVSNAKWSALAFVLTRIVFWFVVATWLHHIGYFWKI